VTVNHAKYLEKHSHITIAKLHKKYLFFATVRLDMKTNYINTYWEMPKLALQTIIVIVFSTYFFYVFQKQDYRTMLYFFREKLWNTQSY
jgi:hypothetical protein